MTKVSYFVLKTKTVVNIRVGTYLMIFSDGNNSRCLLRHFLKFDIFSLVCFQYNIIVLLSNNEKKNLSLITNSL